jgi:HK97 family phage major capsid protein
VITYLQRLTDERDSLTQSATQLAERAATDDRDLTDTERSSMAGWQQRCGEIDAQLTEYNAQAESARAYASLRAQLATPEPSLDVRSSSSAPAVLETRSAGELFVTSDAFIQYGGHGQSARVAVEGFMETRAAITTAQLAIPHFVHTPVELVSSSPLLDVCARIPVSSGVVDWVEVGADPVAAVVPEGTPKPEAAIPIVPKSSSLDTLAHWIQITRQALEDAPYVRAMIEGKLRRGLLRKAEADMAAAIDAATTQTTAGAAGAGLLPAIRVGIGLVESAGYRPNAVALNPADYAQLDVDVMHESVAGPVRYPTFWGVPPVAVAGIPAGKAYVGDFQAGATLFDRGVTDVFISDSHDALFIANILVILAEARLKSVVTEPPAICECTSTP